MIFSLSIIYVAILIALYKKVKGDENSDIFDGGIKKESIFRSVEGKGD